MTAVDLHLHSNYSSDGEFSPKDLVGLCLAAGLTHAAIADHNSVRGVAEAFEAAEGTSLTIIPAVELDCEYQGMTLHLLGYGIDDRAPEFNEIELDLHQQEQENSALLVSRVRQLGIEFEDEAIAGLAYDGVVNGEMIAEAALAYDSEAKNPLLDPYRGDGHRRDNPLANFYWDYCSQGKPAYTPLEYMPLFQAIAVIRANGGVPVLAHPGLQVKENADLLAGIIKEGIAGLEVYCSYHSRELSRFFHNAAQTNRLLMTCGSDFHGRIKQSIKIGAIDCEGCEQQIVHDLLQAIAQR